MYAPQDTMRMEGVKWDFETKDEGAEEGVLIFNLFFLPLKSILISN